MKINVMMREFTKQTAIVIAVLSVVGGLVYYILSLDEEYNGKIQNIKAQSSKISSDANALIKQYSEVTNGMSLYNEIKQKRENNMLTVSKLSLRDAVAAARNKLAISNIDVEMGEIKAIAEPNYKLTTVFAESSVVTIKLSAVTDLDIMSFVSHLQDSFSALKFNDIKINKVKDLDGSSLTEIKKTGFSPLVGATINFTWYGMQDGEQSVKDKAIMP